MRRTTSKNGRSAAEKRKRLGVQIATLEARLRKARAQLERCDEFGINEAAEVLEVLVDRVQNDGERLYLRRGNKRVAALVPADEGEYLEGLEDKHWTEVADEAAKEPGTIPLERVKKELGL